VQQSIASTEPAPSMPGFLPDLTSAQHMEGQSLHFFAKNATSPSNVMNHSEPFKANLNIDLKKLVGDEKDLLHYKITLIAKRLEGGFQEVIGEKEEQIRWTDVFDACVDDLSLEPGTYRLESVISISQINGNTTPIGSFLERDMLLVQ